MTDAEYDREQDELDRLLNDPEIPMDPDRIWDLTDNLASAPSGREHRIRQAHARPMAFL